MVVEALRDPGAVFVEEIDDVPEGSDVIFSAHGVPRATRQRATARRLRVVDATCPLIAKVHHEVVRHYRAGRAVVLVGHADHVEVEGTLGQLPPGAVRLVFYVADVAAQTTLVVDEVGAVAEALRARFQRVPAGTDVCFATLNRQAAVRRIAPLAEKLIVIGSANSSNSRRLVEVAVRAGCDDVVLVENAGSLDWGGWTSRRLLDCRPELRPPNISSKR